MSNSDNQHQDSSMKEIKYVPTEGENVAVFEPEDQIKKPDTLFFYFTVTIVLLPMLITGATAGWSSPAMIKFQSNDTNINPLGKPITTTELSMLLGIPGIFSLLGTSQLPRLADVIGRKKSIHVFCLATFLSYVGIAFSTNITILIIYSSILTTFLSGIWTVLPIYITEICEDHNRAKFGCLLMTFIPVGELYSFVIGPVFSIKYFTLIIISPLIPFLLLFFLVPESPVYSLIKNRETECRITLRKLRSNKSTKQLNIDFNNIRKTISPTQQSNGSNICKLLNIKEGKVGVILATLPILVQLLSGAPIITSLLAPIFNSTGSDLSGNFVAVVVGVVKLISFFITSLVIEKVGRKTLLVTSAVGMGLAMLSLGTLVYLKYINSSLIVRLQWAPVASVLLYVISFALGVGPVPTVIIGEMFSSEFITTAYAFILTSVSIVFTIYMFAYPIVAASFGTHWCMWIFGCTCILGAFIMGIVLPETKGKSISEIQEILKNY